MSTQYTPQSIDLGAERAYWQNRYQKEPYVEAGSSYNDYDAAYRTGYEGYNKYQGRPFESVERDLKSDWEQAKGDTRLAWEKVKQATRAAWDRVERAMPGDADNDGR
jgi:hypothetical protein